jgi:eukaryotic-like serine/threonine-protein kinase
MRRVTSAPSPPPGLLPGAIVAGKYRVDRVLGRGGMGVVVEAHHLALDERVALKILLPELAMNPEAATRFLREARAAVRIKSEHVARVTDVGTAETGGPYMVMELLEGSDLGELLDQGLLPVPDAIDYVVQACEAIAEAHAQGIIHRDLKPSNLFLTRRADGSPLVKVLDFGISKMVDSPQEKLTRTGTGMGSALYMSPEQMKAASAVDQRTDIYALGVTLYELIGGTQPFHADSMLELCAEILNGVPTPLRDHRPDVPEALAVVIEKAYERDREQRHPSVAAMVAALAPFAPPRSQASIERICRMGGIEINLARTPEGVPIAGERADSLAMTAPLPAGAWSHETATGKAAAPAEEHAPRAPRPRPQTTGPGTSSPTPRSTKGPIVAVAVVAVLALGGGGAFLATRGAAARDASTTTALASPAPVSPSTSTAAPPNTSTETAPPASVAGTLAAPATSAAPVASATATALALPRPSARPQSRPGTTKPPPGLPSKPPPNAAGF